MLLEDCKLLPIEVCSIKNYEGHAFGINISEY